MYKNLFIQTLFVSCSKKICYIPISLNSNIPFSPISRIRPEVRFYLPGDRHASRLGIRLVTRLINAVNRYDTIDQTQLAARDILSRVDRTISTIGEARRRARATN